MAEQPSIHLTDVLVPEVRLVELRGLDAELSKQRPDEQVQALHGLERETRDLISIEVTRHASGPGEYKLTLNNWDPYNAGRRHKYNDLAVLKFGQRLRIDMRYMGDTRIDIYDLDAQKTGWVPMIAGPITDLQFSFGSEGSRISISGEDDLRPLKDHNEKKRPYRSNEREIIKDTVRARYPMPVEIPDIAADPFAFVTDNNPQNRINERHDEGQSYLQYIQKFLDLYDLELFLEFDHPDDAAKVRNQILKVVRSRAHAGWKAAPGDVIAIRHGRELIDFSPTIKVADQFTAARVRGRSRFRDEPKGIAGVAESNIVAEEVERYQQEGRDKPVLVPAPDVRRRFFAGDNEPPGKDKTNLDKRRAKAAAHTKLLRKARELVVIQATTIGLPRLRPGRYVRIDGVDRLFDGYYYVTSTTHSWGSDGAKARFTAQRAGLPLPDENQGAAA
jgi:hypothetical protein